MEGYIGSLLPLENEYIEIEAAREILERYCASRASLGEAEKAYKKLNETIVRQTLTQRDWDYI